MAQMWTKVRVKINSSVLAKVQIMNNMMNVVDETNKKVQQQQKIFFLHEKNSKKI